MWGYIMDANGKGQIFMDPSNFQKGLRSRAEKAEADVRRLEKQIDELKRQLYEAQRGIPLRVLEDSRKIDGDPLLRDMAEDALRWRWLRDRHERGDDQWFVYGASSGVYGALQGEVDRMMAENKS